MGKKGRPPKDRPRYPGGQIKPEGAGITGTALQRLRQLGTNPVLETQVGRLLFLGELDLTQAQTAWRIAEIYGRYDRAMGRRRSAASPAYEVGRGRDMGLTESEDEAERSAAAVRRYKCLRDAIAELAPPQLARTAAGLRLCYGLSDALAELCVEDHVIPAEWMLTVKVALDRLAEPLGLRGKRRG